MGRTVANVVHVSAILLTAAALLCGIAFAAVRVLGYEPFIVVSGSMEPAIHTGALAFIDRKHPEVAVGDAVAYTAADGMTVIHRIVGEDEGGNGWFLRGDANNANDLFPVAKSSVLGPCKGSIPGLGYALEPVMRRTVRTPVGEVPGLVLWSIAVIVLFNILDQAVFGSLRQDE